jgi:predicted nucleic acid-binding protein
MNGNVFLDTNIFIYTYSEDLNKKERSFKLFNLPCITSTQVLSELSNVCFKKLKFSDKEISTVIKEVMSSCDIFIVNERTIQQAVFIKSRYGYSYYDSLILSSALESDCSTLYSEDMQHGQIVEGSLKIMNPFA